MAVGARDATRTTAPSTEQLVELLRTTDPERIRWRAGSRLARAVLLAPSIDVCEALLLGEAVPLSRLDPVWVRRFGLR